MANDKQLEFLQTCEAALLDGTFKRAVFNSRAEDGKKFRASFDLLVGGKKNFITYADNNSAESRRLELDGKSLLEMMAAPPITPFRTGLLCTSSFDLHYSENRKLQPRLYRSKASMKNVDQQHNRAKNYVLDSKRPYLQGLGGDQCQG